MNIINKLKSTIQDASSAGVRRVEDLRDDHRRKALFTELGQLTYRQHQGEDIDPSAFSPVLAELDELGSEGDVPTVDGEVQPSDTEDHPDEDETQAEAS